MFSLLVVFLLIGILLFSILSKVFICLWIYKDAKQRGLNAVLWLLAIIFISTIFVLVFYILIGRKENGIICKNGHTVKTEDGRFCAVCGEEVIPENIELKNYNNLLVGYVVSFILAIILLSVLTILLSVAL